MNYELLFKTAMLAGEIMAINGAETFRVEDTIYRILKTSDLQFIDIHATTTGIMASLSDKSMDTITGVKRIMTRSTNLSRINEVNQISRDICSGILEIDVAYERLLKLKDELIYSKRATALAIVISSMGFVGLLGGNIIEVVLATFCGMIHVLVNLFIKKQIANSFARNFIICFAIALFSMITTLIFPHADSEVIIIGSLMPLVPGVAITNAIRDTLQGDYMSGTARAVEAFVISLSIAVGVAAGIGLFDMIGRML